MLDKLRSLTGADEPDEEENSIKVAELSKSEAYEMLKNPRRRSVIRLLAEDGGPIDKRHISEVLAREEHGDGYKSQDRKRIYVALHQVHLPKMGGHGVIHELEDGVYVPTDTTLALNEIDDEISDRVRG